MFDMIFGISFLVILTAVIVTISVRRRLHPVNREDEPDMNPHVAGNVIGNIGSFGGQM